MAGVAFAVPQFLVSNFHGPWLVDVIAAVISMGAVTLFLRVWHPAEIWTSPAGLAPTGSAGAAALNGGRSGTPGSRHGYTARQVRQAWAPWLILSVVVFVWGLPDVKAFLDSIWVAKFPVEGMHNMIQRVPPVVATPTPEAAVYTFNILSMPGTGILVSAIIGGFVMGCSVGEMVRTYFRTIWLVRYSLITIAAMLALGYTTRYSGLDATLGLAFAQTGLLYPFFGSMLGWLGVALTGSDTASNVLFGSLQRISAEQLGLNPTLMAAANSSGGVMGKMIDAQSIVVAATATNWHGHEGSILRYVFWHSIALACLMGILVMLQAYVPPFTGMVVPGPS